MNTEPSLGGFNFVNLVDDTVEVTKTSARDGEHHVIIPPGGVDRAISSGRVVRLLDELVVSPVANGGDYDNGHQEDGDLPSEPERYDQRGDLEDGLGGIIHRSIVFGLEEVVNPSVAVVVKHELGRVLRVTSDQDVLRIRDRLAVFDV